MARKATADKPARRQRGSITAEAIISGAFELAEEISIDNLSMPLLGKHLGVGVTSIYWYFRKKDDLLNAMTDEALRQTRFDGPYVDAQQWCESLRSHAHHMRKTFMCNPILTDLVLIRGALGPRSRRLGVEQMELAIAALVEAGLSPGDAFDTYSATTVHVRGSVVLERLFEKNQQLQEDAYPYDRASAVDSTATPILAKLGAEGHRIGVADDHNFAYGLECILDHAEHLIAANSRAAKAKPAKAKPAKAAGARAAHSDTAASRTTSANGSRRIRRTS